MPVSANDGQEVKQVSVNVSQLLAGIARSPGVYRMLDATGKSLYIGKARNLRNRLRSYFFASQSLKVERLMTQTQAIELTVTTDEATALILESSLIKRHRPRYNVLLRDDKSYPYLRLDLHHPFPRISFYRGSRHSGERYFGPYTNTRAVRKTLTLLQKLFCIRNCTDNFFRHRSRPCLQYQIHRCSAPCVGYISQNEYRQDLERAVLFLRGRSEQVVEQLAEPMRKAAEAHEYERAAAYRDVIANLRQVQQDHTLDNPNASLDVVACALSGGEACIQVFKIRGGAIFDSQAFFLRCPADLKPEEALSAFLAQHYLEGCELPAELLLSHTPRAHKSLRQALERSADRHIPLRTRGQGERHRWLALARENATTALLQQHDWCAREEQGIQELTRALALPQQPGRIECFDVSHSGGEVATASCVVYAPGVGRLPADYRRFNISGVEPGDDYAALHQAVIRSFRQHLRRKEPLPDLLLIDGGRGQAARVELALTEMKLSVRIRVVGVAKRPGHKARLATLYNRGQALHLAPDSAALHLVLRIRDEAHRFALQGHRRRRAIKGLASPLESIPGIGSELRRRLLQHFGGLQGVRRAAASELAKVPGIGPARSNLIHRQLHEAFK